MISSNTDLLTLIFLHLPAKTLIRFKLVCKLWQSLISDHHFSHSHTNRHVSKPKHTLLFHTPKSQHYYLLQNSKLVQSHFSTELTTPTVCSFSNGLFLLRCDDLQSAPVFCVVYNPTTIKSRNVLLNVNDDVFTCVVGLNVAFDPLKSPHFKIVCVRSARRRISGFWRSWNRRCRIEVFDSDKGEWAVCGEQFFVPSELDFDRGVYWNDGIHWRGIYFDLITMNVSRQPVIMDREDYVIFAFEHYEEVNGSLNCILHFGKENLVEVFELKRDYSEWVLKCRVSVDGCSGRGMYVLGIEWGESEGDGELVVYEAGKVMTYGFREKAFREVVGSEVEIFEEDSVRYDSRGKGELSVLGMYWEDKEGDSKLVVHDHETGKVVTCWLKDLEEELFKDLVGVKVKLFYRKCGRFDSRYSFQFLETLAHV